MYKTLSFNSGKPPFHKITNLIFSAFPKSTISDIKKVCSGKNFIEWVWLAIDGNIIGITAIFKKKSHIMFGFFCIHDKYRGRGYGSKLLKYLFFLYGGKIKCNVNRREEGLVQFYKKNGMKEISRTEKYIIMEIFVD